MAKDLKISLLMDYYGNLLTDKQREVVSLYYDEDLSLAEIAEHAGITRQGVRDCIKRAEFQLLDCEEKLGHARRFNEIQKGLDNIMDCAKNLQEQGGRGPFAEQAQHILDIAMQISTEESV